MFKNRLLFDQVSNLNGTNVFFTFINSTEKNSLGQQKQHLISGHKHIHILEREKEKER